ncbi:helix-turn-helix domain-containing protein [Bacillaceae bacterium SIJ1]|uniref:helix-turn-helix domain-containing protein n=1 Tax=Litoribacterium kuwaitense TaxID=1398745 RepID=UPI0013ED79CA|nr:helix-turn-helix domain-containing protein [Litoribacterium kuwaitense]NGP44068.1 helix-turn-helix domain-containing protein [Litoribacterium kuwaitense]
MTELGQYLREQRQAQGISLEELQRTTKIQARYLEAIEEGHYDALPGQFYARAFVRQYAEALGLSAEEVFQAYEKEIPQPTVPDEIPSRMARSKHVSTQKSTWARALPKVLTAVVIVAALIALYMLVIRFLPSDDGERSDDASPSVQTENMAPEEQPDQATEEDVTQGNGTDSTEDASPDPSEDQEEQANEPTLTAEAGEGGIDTVYTLQDNAEQFVLTFEVSGRAYIGVRAPGGSQIIAQKTLAPEEGAWEVDVSSYETINLRLPRAYDTKITVNGVALSYDVDANQQKDQTLLIKKTSMPDAGES